MFMPSSLEGGGVRRGVGGAVMPESLQFCCNLLCLFTRLFPIPFSSFAASETTAALTTCCPSWLSWLYAASVPSWCPSAPLWRSSFTKGESHPPHPPSKSVLPSTVPVTHKYKHFCLSGFSELNFSPCATFWTCKAEKQLSV